ncbi:MAG: hypothetical protein LBQ40_06120 [Clostridiales bacterium]|jgi:hypothetical protein|nr:hypothetical protein [Clostridiales bacterium]
MAEYTPNKFYNQQVSNIKNRYYEGKVITINGYPRVSNNLYIPHPYGGYFVPRLPVTPRIFPAGVPRPIVPINVGSETKAKKGSKALAFIGAIFSALFVLALFGGSTALLWGMAARWYGYAIVIGASLLIFMSRSDASRLYRILSWTIAIGLCCAALYIARPNIEMSVFDNITDAVNEILALFGK